MKGFFATILDQLREPVDRRTQYILYIAIALLAFFIVDSTTRTIAEDTESMIEAQKTRIENLEISHARLTVLKFTRERIQNLENEIAAVQARNEKWLNELQECTEASLIDLIQTEPNQSSPFENFSVSQSSQQGTLQSIGYTLSLEGTYADVIQFIDRISQSPCGQNLTEWNLVSTVTPPEDLVEASIDLRLLQTVEESES